MSPKPNPLLQALVDSFVSRLCALDIGESEAKARRLECDTATKAALTATIDALRNSIAASVKQATAKTGYKYTVESGDIRTRSFDFLVVVTVTRTA